MIDVGPAGDGHAVLRKDQPLRTPGGAALVVPTAALAGEIAREQKARKPRKPVPFPPLTRLAFTALDRVMPDRTGVIAGVAAYGKAELLVHRAEAPPELVTRQAERWDPVLDWARCELGAELQVAAGVTPVDQPPEALEVLEAAVGEEDPFALAALWDMVALSGSLVLGLAVLRGHLAATAAWELSVLDEAWQEEHWGQDEEATFAAAHRRDAFLAAEAFLVLAGRIQPRQ